MKRVRMDSFWRCNAISRT